MDDEKPIKIEAHLDTYKGNVSFNILEILKQLDHETREGLMLDGGWWSIVTDEMAEAIVDEFSREHYNAIYTSMRQKILNSESMPKVITQWATSVFESASNYKEEGEYWRDAYWQLYHWNSEQHKNDNYRDWDKTMPRLPERKYNKEYSKELMAKVKDQIEEWGLLFPDPEE